MQLLDNIIVEKNERKKFKWNEKIKFAFQILINAYSSGKLVRKD